MLRFVDHDRSRTSKTKSLFHGISVIARGRLRPGWRSQRDRPRLCVPLVVHQWLIDFLQEPLKMVPPGKAARVWRYGFNAHHGQASAVLFQLLGSFRGEKLFGSLA